MKKIYISLIFILFFLVACDSSLSNEDITDYCTITFKADETIVQSITIKTGESLKTIPSPPNSSEKEFLFWSIDGTNPYDFSSPIMTDTTLQAVWKNIEIYKILLISNNELFAELKVPNGTILGETNVPPTPDGKTGFLFWSTNPNGASIYDSSLPITDDIILYAIWMPEPLLFSKYKNQIILTSVLSQNLCDDTLTIPYGVSAIGEKAFIDCELVKKVIIPDSVIQIGKFAFASSGITTITIPNGITQIEDSVFKNCGNLKDVFLPNSITKIGSEAFQNCGIKNIDIPNSVKELGSYSFAFSNLNQIQIPNGVTKIGSAAFDSCIYLEEITIPDSVIEIGPLAFRRNENLTEISLPNKITEIKDYVFYDCKNLKEINIPNSVIQIGINAFYNCASLTEIVIPNSVTNIKGFAFDNCNNLTDIYCEASSQPSGWASNWLGNCKATIHWGYKN